MFLGALKRLSSLTLLSKVDPIGELKLLASIGKQQVLWRREQHLKGKYVLIHLVRCRFAVESLSGLLKIPKIQKKLGKGYFHYIPKIC